MIIKSDILKFRSETEAMRLIMEEIEKELPKELLRIEFDYSSRIMYRVKFLGITANGSVMQTKSNNPMGAYGQRHGKARRLRGLRIDQVNLNYTGMMNLDFDITEKADMRIGIGFLTTESAEKAKKNEAYYGDEIFEPSWDEERDTMNDAEQRLFGLLQKVI
jgi:hypothetical protein